jgi:uncharacterized protein (DUF1499 family)
VCSHFDDPAHFIPPLRYHAKEQEALHVLLDVLGGFPRMEIVTVDGLYVHAVARSRLWRRQRRIEFLFEPEYRIIHVRAADPWRRFNVGASRRFVEALRKQFADRAPPPAD